MTVAEVMREYEVSEEDVLAALSYATELHKTSDQSS
jgi:uncharacterized protein (DUF433 family)